MSNKQLAIIQSIPASLMPENMPFHEKGLPALPQHLLNLDALSIQLLAPKRFFSLDGLVAELEMTNSTSLVLTIDKFCYDMTASPDATPTEDDWALCVTFVERQEKLILNARTRLIAMARIFGSPLVGDWIKHVENNAVKIELFKEEKHGQNDALGIEVASKATYIDEADF